MQTAVDPLWRRSSAFLAAAVLLPVLALPAHAQRDDKAALKQTSSAFAAVARKAMPAVVFIQVEKSVQGPAGGEYFFNDPFDFFGDDFMRRFFRERERERDPRAPRQRRWRQQGQGSGFIISKDGYILTNNHVVGDADKITVKLHDGRQLTAKRVGSDPKSEVALVKVEADNLPFLEPGDVAALDIGDWVIAIGNPFGLAETLTVGVVSAKGRSNIGIADYEDFIQTDAAINPGNSGGPLLNIDGQVIGINTAIYSQSGGYMGIGFAIPINMAVAIKDQLVKSGKVVRGFLGIMLQPLTPDLAKTLGVDAAAGILVGDVTRDSPAEKAGIKAQDVIVKLNGRNVESVSDFRNKVSSALPGTELELTVLRAGKQVEIKARTGTLPDEQGEGGREETGAVEKLGVSVQELTAEMAQRLGYPAGEGVLVSEVEPGSPAAERGLRPGCLVTEVNKKPVNKVAEFNEAVAEAAKQDLVLMRIRDGKYARYEAIRLR